MMARLFIAVAVAFAIVACASIDPPASFVPAEAATDPSSSDAATCTRVLPRSFGSDAQAKLYGAPGGPQAICVTLEVLEVPASGPGLVTFCVAGNDLGTASVRVPRDIIVDTRTCAYCIDVRTNCRRLTDAGIVDIAPPCDTSYAPVKWTMRIVQLGTAPNDEVWFDVGDLVLARVRGHTDAGAPLLDPLSVDCLAADGLTFQGRLVAVPSCTDDSVECQIANSASSRFP